MERILGGQAPYPTGTSPNPGTPYQWNGSAGSTNTTNGNKLTAVTLVGWKARGGLPVSFTLTHNSKSTHSESVGQKWSHNYDAYLYLDSTYNVVTAHWG